MPYSAAASRTLEPCDSPDWQAALVVYRGEIVKSELISRDIAGINTALARIENTESLKGSGISDNFLDSQNKLFQQQAVWHAVLFYTTGKCVRRQLGDYKGLEALPGW